MENTQEAAPVATLGQATSQRVIIKLLLTIPEAAESLGVCRSIVYDLVLTGQLASIKIGRARRVPVTALQEFVAQRLAG